jgi:lysophospholipid acyltransferase (LPLAT)-like uncharacterized protein
VNNDGRKIRWSSRLGTTFIRAIARTWRFRIVADGYFAQERLAGRSVVIALWHGEMLPLLYYHRNRSIAVMVSEHGDGEIIARILEEFGFRLIRGSTSRGAARALIAAGRELRAGFDVGITLDGPRGPWHSVAPGALIAAQRAGVVVIPVVARPRSCWRLGSWDRFMIPKPFTQITIAYGDPIRLDRQTSREAGERTGLLTTAMTAAAERAAG